ncbi:MAG: nitrate reductase molybdenum cofactor assembly chaperone [Xanthomonadales bacterium]|nr:nitrate reductase molybdenum cofactor assembly chaperone [Xanthomonadales bacterium]
MKTFKVLSLLLAYPEQEWFDHLDECKQILSEEKLLSNKSLKSLFALVERIQASDLITAQEEYVAIFDRGPAHSLHLFEHIHGESRDRGQAMVDLMEMYNANGLGISTSELPDYLPVFLEFLATGNLKEATSLLANTAKVIVLVKERLAKKQHDYQYVFSALLELSAAKVNQKEIKQMVAKEKDEISFDDIDKQWVEPEAFAKNPFKSRDYLNQKIKINLVETVEKPENRPSNRSGAVS